MHYSNNELEKNYINNYPDQLEFKKENEDSCKASFLENLQLSCLIKEVLFLFINKG